MLIKIHKVIGTSFDSLIKINTYTDFISDRKQAAIIIRDFKRFQLDSRIIKFTKSCCTTILLMKTI